MTRWLVGAVLTAGPGHQPPRRRLRGLYLKQRKAPASRATSATSCRIGHPEIKTLARETSAKGVRRRFAAESCAGSRVAFRFAACARESSGES